MSYNVCRLWCRSPGGDVWRRGRAANVVAVFSLPEMGGGFCRKKGNKRKHLLGVCLSFVFARPPAQRLPLPPPPFGPANPFRDHITCSFGGAPVEYMKKDKTRKRFITPPSTNHPHSPAHSSRKPPPKLYHLFFSPVAGHDNKKKKKQELLEEYDSDKSGTLSFSEFVELWSDELLDAEDDELMFQRAFQFFDKDGNGDISLDEFREVLTELGDPLKESELDLFFRLVDKNGGEPHDLELNSRHTPHVLQSQTAA